MLPQVWQHFAVRVYVQRLVAGVTKTPVVKPLVVLFAAGAGDAVDGVFLRDLPMVISTSTNEMASRSALRVF